jgi:hypothetical protein
MNDIPYDVHVGPMPSFPTVKLFPAGSKSQPIDYQGPRTAFDMLKWVQRHAG